MIKSTDLKPEEIEFLARLRHDANIAVCLLFGDTSQKPWGPDNPYYESSLKEVIAEVDFVGNRDDRRRQSHEAWLAHRTSQGYVYGPVRNDDESKGQKTHPGMVPYEQRPQMDIVKGSMQDKALDLGLAILRQKRELDQAASA